MVKQGQSCSTLVLAARAQPNIEGRKPEKKMKKTNRSINFAEYRTTPCIQRLFASPHGVPVEAPLKYALIAEERPAAEVNGKHSLRCAVMHRDKDLLIKAHVQGCVLWSNQAFERLAEVKRGQKKSRQ
jgi:hypothetical protein